MSQASLEKAIPEGDRILLDTSALLAYLGVPAPTTPLVRHVIDEYVRSGRNLATVSMVTVMEILVRPLAAGPGPEYVHVMDFLQRFPNLRAVPIDLPIAQEAASLRAQHKFKTPDALVIATGLAAHVGHLVCNDAQWKSRLSAISTRVKVLYLEDHLPF
ncbi:MAG TPA: hypothetical protein DCK98_06370 [Chloroflexi bacterium]|nr:hypothetical protein [Chloroflexota bacterium]HAL26989.1 hypothetical protein [Chloroflexota bacterium]